MWSRLVDVARRHPAVAYFVLTFVISWGGLVALVGPTHLLGTKEEFERLIPIAIPVVALGPTTASLVLTALLDGRRGLRALGSSLTRWRVDGRWYVVAIMLAPFYTLVSLLVLSLWSRAFVPALLTTPEPVSLLLSGFFGALVAGLVEELGWTGFAIPRLRRRFGPTATGLVVGVLWGMWHALPKLWGAAAHDLLAYAPQDLACAIVGLTGFRILMVWVYDETQSLLVAVLMHFGLTLCALVLTPAVTGGPLMIASYVTAVVPWLLVGTRYVGFVVSSLRSSRPRRLIIL